MTKRPGKQAERRIERLTRVLAGIERATGKDPRPLGPYVEGLIDQATKTRHKLQKDGFPPEAIAPILRGVEEELCRDEP